MGMVTMFDTGTPDSGVVIIVDFGTSDLGTRDLGRDLGSSSCTPSVIDYIAGAYCSTSTASCARACADGPCITACLNADPTTDCARCSNQNLLACANENGCQSQWNTFNCCVDDNCPTGSPSTCVDTFCMSEGNAYTACANSVLPGATCMNNVDSCFP